MRIIETIGTEAVLEQLAEESAELAQAALKLARKMRGVNPTPKEEEEDECWDNLIEEMADVQVCWEQLDLGFWGRKVIHNIAQEKTARWARRLAAKEDTVYANDD